MRLAYYPSRILSAKATDVQWALRLIDEAEQLARTLHEPCWYAVLSWMRGEMYVHELMDMQTGIRVLSEAVVELRKPEYANCLGIEDVYTVLLTAYVYTDPVGYGDRILEGLDYIETQLDPHLFVRHGIWLRRAFVELGRENFPLALQHASRSLQLADDDRFMLIQSYTALAECAHQCGDLVKALEYADTCEAEILQRNPSSNRSRELLQIHGYQMVYHTKQGNLETSAALYTQLSRELQHMRIEPYYTLYESLTWYHDLTGNVDEAIEACRELMTNAQKSGSIYAVAMSALNLYRLYRKAGRTDGFTADDVRHATARLKDPSRILKKLEHIEQGDFSTDVW